MGGKWSKSSIVGWPAKREKRRTTEPAADGVGAVSRNLEKHRITYKEAVDLSLFLKEKGGLEGLIYSKKRQETLDLWVYNTQGHYPDWQKYTPGPGVRYPLTFGWCFKLVPVDPKEVEEANEGEDNCLLHPVCQHGMEDEHREVLKWKFDSLLAYRHMAHELHPECFKDC
uniref:Protein Nef n=1 Tax=Human immunodeficiency virus type 1 TaxID=11676 RepID=A0A059SQG4_HV1|nr:nef protein [Human immunodeficiency virus 1]